MNINRPLMPGFLKRAEQKLLLNKPLIWSTRVHLVLYYGILYNLLLAGLSYLAPLDILGRSNAKYWVGFQAISAIIALTIWLIYLLRFNVFKKYGNIKSLHVLVSFLLYFISTGIMVLSVFIYPVVECVRANMAFSDKELIQDINNMNIKLCQLESKGLNVAWDYDTVALVKPYHPIVSVATSDEVEVAPDTVAIAPMNGHYFGLDSVDFYERLATTDSVIKLKDSLYVIYKAPELRFVFCYKLEEHTKEKLMNSLEIYNRSIKHPPAAAERTVIAKEFNELQKKYVWIKKSDYQSYEGGDRPEDGTYEIIRKKYPIGIINGNIWNIVNKKYAFSDGHLPDIIRVFYYFTLGISLLIFMFRHSTVRTFFLSLLSGVLLTVLTGMTLAFLDTGFLPVLGSFICYTLLFFAGSVFTFSSTKRSVLNGIFINLFVFIIPVLPVLVVDFIYEMKKEEYYKKFNTYDWPFMDQCFLFAEIGGALLFLVLLATYINKLYRRWYSLPEN